MRNDLLAHSQEVFVKWALSQMKVDGNSRYCISHKALRTADHFLLCRYFDYQQVTFHKTVVGYELVLKDVIRELLERSLLDLSTRWVTSMIRDGSWYEFDDASLLGQMRKLRRSASGRSFIARVKANAVLNRIGPKLLVECAYVDAREKASEFKLKVNQVEGKIAEWSTEFGVDKGLWYVWHSDFVITSLGARLPSSTLVKREEEDLERFASTIHVLGDTSPKAESILTFPLSLMKVLSDYAFYALRVYVLLPEDKQGKRGKIADRIQKDCPLIQWS